MWAKITGFPCKRPLKARTLPLDTGKGDCSGIFTFAEKLPSPTSEDLQAESASPLVEGSMLFYGGGNAASRACRDGRCD